MRKRILLAVFVIAVLFLMAAVLVNNQKGMRGRVCSGPYCFNVELAKTTSEITRGLMFRESLNADSGMLFVFEREGAYPFWMKNTLIPLDIIWISAAKKVVYMSENTEPCKDEYFCPSIEPGKNAKYVLELNGGVAERIGLKTGDPIEIFD